MATKQRIRAGIQVRRALGALWAPLYGTGKPRGDRSMGDGLAASVAP
jgi:hypothetical protein